MSSFRPGRPVGRSRRLRNCSVGRHRPRLRKPLSCGQGTRLDIGTRAQNDGRCGLRAPGQVARPPRARRGAAASHAGTCACTRPRPPAGGPGPAAGCWCGSRAFARWAAVTEVALVVTVRAMAGQFHLVLGRGDARGEGQSVMRRPHRGWFLAAAGRVGRMARAVAGRGRRTEVSEHGGAADPAGPDWRAAIWKGRATWPGRSGPPPPLRRSGGRGAGEPDETKGRS